MIMPAGTPGAHGWTPWPNTGTGVQFPGEPVAVMAEGRFLQPLGVCLGRRNAPFVCLSRKTCPEWPCCRHGFLARRTGEAGETRPVFLPAQFCRKEGDPPFLRQALVKRRAPERCTQLREPSLKSKLF